MPEAPAAASKWADLAPRVISGVAMAAVGVAEIWVGGWLFAALVLAITGIIAWEISRMCAPGRPAAWAGLGVLAGVAVLAGLLVPLWAAAALWAGVLALAALAAGPGADRTRLTIYLGYVLVAGWGLAELRFAGLWPVVWLVAVVVATDIAGYFAGRLIGGPRFWPRVSPKKTWSGTAAGWIAAALVGWAFVPVLGAGAIWLSVIVSFASQMGDAAESALKRAKGVKDASAIIPGHGGLFDRFDAMMGAALVVTLARLLGLGG